MLVVHGVLRTARTTRNIWLTNEESGRTRRSLTRAVSKSCQNFWGHHDSAGLKAIHTVHAYCIIRMTPRILEVQFVQHRIFRRTFETTGFRCIDSTRGETSSFFLFLSTHFVAQRSAINNRQEKNLMRFLLSLPRQVLFYSDGYCYHRLHCIVVSEVLL